MRAIDNAIGMDGENVQLTLPDAAMEAFETAAQTRVFYRVSVEREGRIETVTGYGDLRCRRAAGQQPAALLRRPLQRRPGPHRRAGPSGLPSQRPSARGHPVAETAEPRRALIGTVWRGALARDLLLIPVSAAIVIGGVTFVLRPLARVRDDVEARSPDDLTPLAFEHVPVEVRPLVDAVNRHVCARRR